MDNFKVFVDKTDKIYKLLDLLTDLYAGILPNKDVLSIKDVSEYTGLSYSILYQESSHGLMTSAKKGKRLYFPIVPFIDWYIESYFHNPVRRKIMDSAFRSEKSCNSIRMEDLQKATGLMSKAVKT